MVVDVESARRRSEGSFSFVLERLRGVFRVAWFCFEGVVTVHFQGETS